MFREPESGLTVSGHQTLEALFAGEIDEDAGKAVVVLDDQYAAVVGIDMFAVVRDPGLIGVP